MQTPLAELIEWINDYDSVCYPPPENIIAKATELLEKERTVIKDAYLSGGLDGISFANKDNTKFYDASDYFTKTFTDESK